MSGVYKNGLYELPLNQFVEIWVRKDNLPSEILSKYV